MNQRKNNIRNNVKQIVYSAVSLALLIVFQLFTRPLGPVITGSCVNTILAVAALLFPAVASAAVAIVAPFAAFLLGIGPGQFVLIPLIAAGNLVFVLLLSVFAGTPEKLRRSSAAARKSRLLALREKLYSQNAGFGRWFSVTEVITILAALVKCGVLYLLVVRIFGPLFLPEQVLPTISAMFGILQFFTAAIGGTIAAMLSRVLRKVIR